MLAKYIIVHHSIQTHVAARILVRARETEADFNVPRSKAELIPARHHSSRIVHPVPRLVAQLYIERPVGRSDRTRIVPLQVSGLPVVQVYGFPVRIVYEIMVEASASALL